MTVFDHIRLSLLSKKGLFEPPACRFKLSDLYASEWCPEFETLMRNRLVMGVFRYGLIGAPGKKDWDRIKGIKKRLSQYEATHNTECLVDIANLCLLEFVEGKHPDKHFSSFDGDHSCA